MKQILLLIFLFGVTRAIKCPSNSIGGEGNNGSIQYKKYCWDAFPGVLGCCEEKCFDIFTMIFSQQCHCHGECKGWSIGITNEINFNFVQRELETIILKTPLFKGDSNGVFIPRGVTVIYGENDKCTHQRGKSMVAQSNSCVILWEKPGCGGKNVRIDGGSVSDISVHGFEMFNGVSGCQYTPPTSIEIVLNQHSFWSWFGYTKSFTINADKCTNVEGWWNDRASLIKTETGHCFQIWEHKDCSGTAACLSGYAEEWPLSEFIMSGSISWNNQISSLSFCDYS